MSAGTQAAVGRNADGRRAPTVVSGHAALGRNGLRCHEGYFGSRLNEAVDQR